MKKKSFEYDQVLVAIARIGDIFVDKFKDHLNPENVVKWQYFSGGVQGADIMSKTIEDIKKVPSKKP